MDKGGSRELCRNGQRVLEITLGCFAGTSARLAFILQKQESAVRRVFCDACQPSEGVDPSEWSCEFVLHVWLNARRVCNDGVALPFIRCEQLI